MLHLLMIKAIFINHNTNPIKQIQLQVYPWVYFENTSTFTLKTNFFDVVIFVIAVTIEATMSKFNVLHPAQSGTLLFCFLKKVSCILSSWATQRIQIKGRLFTPYKNREAIVFHVLFDLCNASHHIACLLQISNIRIRDKDNSFD